MAAPTVAGLGTFTLVDSTTSIGLPIPTGVQGASVGDLVICQITLDDETYTITGTPPGWTQIGTLQTVNSSAQAMYWAEITSGGDNDLGATVTWTQSVADDAVGRMIAISGADMTTPVHASWQGNKNNFDAVAWTIGSVTTTIADTLLCGFVSNDAGASVSWTINTGSPTEQWNEGDGVSFLHQLCFTQPKTATGTYSYEVELSTGDYETGFLVAVAPEAATAQTISPAPFHPGRVGLG